MGPYYNNKIGIVAVNDILGMDFFIPDYQRGYRWEKLQVTELMNDLLNFMRHQNSGFYCMQPLVVKRSMIDQKTFMKDINNLVGNIENEPDPVGYLEQELQNLTRWEVIDGQQRLTTLFIILMVLGENCPYTITYQTRVNSRNFLMDILNKTDKDGEANIDYQHMVMARNEIMSFLSDKDENVKSLLYNTILEKVKFIWYESIGEDPKEVFTRLNIGKISLTNAELIKAALLNSSNYSGLHSEYIRNKQLQISTKWDEIEYALQNDEFWLFLNDAEQKEFTRIDFLFKLIYVNDRFGLKNTLGKSEYDRLIGNDRYSVYRYFAKQIERIDTNETVSQHLDSVWAEVTTLFDALKEWFDDPILYHYMGYVIWTIEDDRDGITEKRKRINAWYNLWISEENDKLQFVTKIKAEIRDKIIHCEKEELNKLHFDKHKPLIRKILLLHNVQTIVNQKEIQADKYKLATFYKFPFHLFKREVWNVEHIDSATTNELTKGKEQKSWIRAAIASGKLTLDDDVKKMLKTHDKDSIVDFETVYNNVMSQFPTDNLLSVSVKCEDGDDDNERMHIWNLALLDEKTNKSYHNSIFSVKRSFVIYKEQGIRCTLGDDGVVSIAGKSVAFVPICTKQAFMKYYTADVNALMAWTRPDAEAYLKDIKKQINDFLI